jgi:hypothetical protein
MFCFIFSLVSNILDLSSFFTSFLYDFILSYEDGRADDLAADNFLDIFYIYSSIL